MESLFCYGTLLDPQVQRRVIGRTVESRPDALPGYRKDMLLLGCASYYIAVPDPRGEIQGGVIEVTRDELVRIDRYEGDEYERVKVTLVSGKEAWVYRRPSARG